MKTVAEVFAHLNIKIKETQLLELEEFLMVKKQPKETKKYVFVSDSFGPKTPLQMQQAVLCIKNTEAVDLKTWAEKLASYPSFRTQQPVERIVSFYRKRMLQEGLVREA